MAKKDPFPNEWEEVNNLSDDDIEPAVFEEIMEESMVWHLPEPYCAVIRVYNKDTKKLKEYAYRIESKAHERIQESAYAGDEVTIMTNSIIGCINYKPD
jgi:UDP-3-O-[3-hydroxymyristoyl] glucosamine N-acyltransferase